MRDLYLLFDPNIAFGIVWVLMLLCTFLLIYSAERMGKRQ